MTMVEREGSTGSTPLVPNIWTVHGSDARRTGTFLAEVAASAGSPGVPFITTTVTSPPYGNLVDYGTENQIGFGQTFEDYLDECQNIFRDIFSWTKDEGSMWIVADTMMSGPKGGRPSALIPLPFALSDRASQAGWTLRDVIVWHKDRTRPWASPGKLRNAFEYVLFFVKTNDFKYHVDRLRDVRGMKSWWVKYPERHNPWGMTPDNVWDIPIPVQGSWASNELRHACPFPDELVRRMIELSTDDGDTVFDPFAGSGMVPAVAESLGRKPLGTEINEDFRAIYASHIRPSVLQQDLAPLDVDSLDISATLLALRVLKFPKTLASQIMRAGIPREGILALVVLPDAFDLAPRSSPYAAFDCIVVVNNTVSTEFMESVRFTIDKALAQPPLSKWAVSPRVSICKLDDAVSGLDPDQVLSIYESGRTWKSAGKLETGQVADWIENARRTGVPVVLSPLHVSVELED